MFFTYFEVLLYTTPETRGLAVFPKESSNANLQYVVRILWLYSVSAIPDIQHYVMNPSQHYSLKANQNVVRYLQLSLWKVSPTL